MQDMFEQIKTNIKEVTMGYALMNVMDDCDLKHGPKTIAQAINIRAIDQTYLKAFATNMKSRV
jgi:hypothetical protein